MSERSDQTVLIRHGETPWSTIGRHTGWTDLSLSDAGREEAAALRAPLHHWTFSAVLCSTLKRARETCAIAGYEKSAEYLDDAREWNYGDYEGQTTADIHETNPEWRLWTDGVPNGETIAQVAARADRVIARRKEIAGDVAIFAHGHFLRILGARWVGLEPDWARALALSTASICVVGAERGYPAVLHWNDQAHLGSDGG